MKKTTLFFLSNIISAFVFAQSFTAAYTFDSVKTTSGLTDPTPLPTATGVVFGNFIAAGTPTNPNSTIRFNFTDWAIGATTGNNNYASLTGVVDTAEYYKVTIAPAGGFTFSLTDITFKIQRSGTGIRTYAVRSSVDNFATNLAASINPANTKLSSQAGDIFFWNYDSITSAQNGSTITLGGNFTVITAPVTFRFYAWNSEGSSGTFSIDDVTINGTATPVTGINKEIKNEILFFPNPSSTGMFTVSLPTASEPTTITIYDIVGKVILTKQLTNAVIQEINLLNQPNGCYFISINTGIEIFTQKIIINK